MQRLPSLELMQRAVRQRICTQCFQRPHGSESLGPDVARSCQDGCTIFMNLPKLREIVESVHDPMLSPYELAMREMICQSCQASPSAGDYCAERSTENCPLARYAGLVVDALERVTAAGGQG